MVTGRGIMFICNADLLNLLLWLQQMKSLETYFELNIGSAKFRFPFPLGVIYLNNKDMH